MLEGRYVPTLAIALAALVPYILVTSASDLYRDQLLSDVGISKSGLELASSMATAGYAFGALLAGDLINRFEKKHLFVIAEAIAVLAWGGASAATNAWLFGIAFAFTGFTTGLLLVIALPPTVQQFPSSQVPLTAAFINIGLFGAIAAGPLLGGMVAAAHSWRWLYVGFAALAALALLLALFTLRREKPVNPDLPLDRSALILGAGATFLPFGAAATLSGGGFGSALFLAPLVIGLACFAALLLTEYLKKEPLAPVKRMWSTFPLVGTLVATIGGGVFVTLMRLMVARLQQVSHFAPLATGVIFWPQLVGALVTAALLCVLFRTRFLPLLVLGGMLMLLGGGALIVLAREPDPRASLTLAAALLGLGAGATVSPGLFLSGFALPSNLLGRIIALIELIRCVGDFLLAPMLLQVAKIASGSSQLTLEGTNLAAGVSVAIAAAATVACVLLYVAGTLSLPKPDIGRWLDRKEVAVESPPLLARLRR